MKNRQPNNSLKNVHQKSLKTRKKSRPAPDNSPAQRDMCKDNISIVARDPSWFHASRITHHAFSRILNTPLGSAVGAGLMENFVGRGN